jgi:hypothetical protein
LRIEAAASSGSVKGTEPMPVAARGGKGDIYTSGKFKVQSSRFKVRGV